jgi:predicted O-methyltransferase YrrM
MNMVTGPPAPIPDQGLFRASPPSGYQSPVPIGSIISLYPLLLMQVSKKTMDPADIVMREIEEMGKKSFIPSIGPVKGKILAEIVKKHKPRKTLEVGALYGYSAILICKNSPVNAEITSVEKNPEHVRMTEQNVERAKLEDQIKVIQGDAMEILPTLPGPFDLVFLDAEKTQYLDYLKAVENKLHQGSVVVADNVGVFQDQMQNYLHYVRNTGRYRSRTVETLLEFSDTTKDAMEISEKRY